MTADRAFWERKYWQLMMNPFLPRLLHENVLGEQSSMVKLNFHFLMLFSSVSYRTPYRVARADCQQSPKS
jgi:hypothetical protein